ncbi:ABC transporter permease [bacterium endosymbiont of Pedicinus badii]|uniref:ABC transporter permease n=1 Tax=bacterium endosymbiont of Pedicinus badii TaxID=1719126 RepID=UPI0009B99D8C|nr:ABC transporter permease [bacterium endosymbiont of Pedicinus badii]OQM34236.1 ABC transporter permease [bacterium endosymbiont of Pedicinus badii]
MYFIALNSILKKEIKRFSRIWIQTLAPPTITMTLYFIIFGNFIGLQIKSINGYSYIQFIVPGLIMMTTITNAYMNVSSSFFSAKFQKSIEEILVAPIPIHIIIIGYVGGGVIRAFIVSILVICISLLFTSIKLYSGLLMVLLLLLTSVLFSLLGLFNAILAKNFDDISIVPTFVLTPLIYLGGVFYSLNLLPNFWKYISFINPILYIVNSFRYSVLGYSEVSVWIAIFILIFFIFVFYFLCWKHFKNISFI